MATDSPRSILARLEQLKLWQEQQQKVLIEKQIAQRELLNQEQKKMYTILGIDQTGGPPPPDRYDDDDRSDQEFEQTNMQRQLEQDGRKAQVPAKPFLKRGEGLKARFKVDPNVFKLDNLPKYKYANHAKNRAQKKQQQGRQPEEKKTVKEVEAKPEERRKRSTSPMVVLDINKVQQQKKLIVPEPEPALCVSESVESISEDTISKESLLPSIESIKLRQNPCVPATTIEKPSIEQSIPWKQQLQDDASLLRQLKELKDLNLFEFLEQRLATGNGSVASDASALLRLLSENSINISELMMDSTLVPVTPAKPVQEPLVEPEEVRCLAIRPAPDPKRHVLRDEEGSDSSDGSDEDEDEDEDVHVRFANSDDSDGQQRDETELELQTVNYSRMSTPKEKRERISAEESVQEETDEQKRIREEMLGKSELLKQRLGELETEIDSFRKENAELTRMKQEHELEKIRLEQEREEMMEKLNDERIKMEVYFHDERIKIEDQRQKALKEAMRPSKKEKEEILRLKEQIAELQKEMKAKEAKHASSQARFRSQIKSLEKDLKETQLELDVMKKDNKKLETENARLKRQNNSKMLLEINKNIAKLAAPQTASESRRNSSPEKPRKTNSIPSKMKAIDVVEKNVAGKVATAKVISHPRVQKKQQSLLDDSSSDPENLSPQDSSDELSGCETLELSKSSYFKAKSKKNLFNNSDPERPNQSAEDNSTLRDPETAELIKNLKREVVNPDGSRDIWYPNGNLKKISPDGLVQRMLYFNKDIKETNLSEGTTKYYYFETNTWHTTYLDGLEILEFPDGQTEHRFKDGSTEVHFPNGSIRTTNPNSAEIAEEWKYPDGSTVLVKKNDDKVITLPNGQVEIHTKAHKRRIYPDGTVKFLYPDGSQESRYSNGRVRLKDKDGNLISDTGGGGGSAL